LGNYSFALASGNRENKEQRTKNNLQLTTDNGQRTTMHACPSCSAPLDEEGICTSCGALTRGFFRGLDLGTPQIAAAVANGLDFYQLLGVAPEADIRSVARRYRQLRVLFPDDPSGLAAAPARRLALLEHAGRVLTDPRLRQSYAELRAGSGAGVTNAVLRCSGSAAPLPAESTRCSLCGTPRPPDPQLPAAPPLEPGPPPAEPLDYYALLGLTAEHLLQPAMASSGTVPRGAGVAGLHRLGSPSNQPPALPPGPPSREAIDAAALAIERKLLLAPGYTPEERESRLHEIEIARRILHDDQRRSVYDQLLIGFRQGLLGGGRLESLSQLQGQVRADMAEERGEQLPVGDGAALLKQGLGYLNARLAREALEPLRRAVAALPRSPEAHAAYAQAILDSDDPLALGGHLLRQALRSLDALETLRAAEPRGQAESRRREGLAALCRGLLARDQGDPATAQAQLTRAAELDSQLTPAWCGLAALALARRAIEEALGYCGRALAIDQQSERALTLAIGACLLAGKRADARMFAGQLAAARGQGWSAQAVLQELGG
jgi:Tfp pilus assembly protein PilF